MNTAQKRIVVFALYALSALLVLVFWSFGTEHDFHKSMLIWRLRETTNGTYGLRLRMGEVGVILGLILPTLLAAAAAFFSKADD